MVHILIVLWTLNSQLIAFDMQEFATKESCEIARGGLRHLQYGISGDVESHCIPK